MSKRKRRPPPPRKNAPPSKPRKGESPKRLTKLLLGGASIVVTGVVTGVIVNLLTPAAQKEISPSRPPSGPPLTIVSEDPVFPLISANWVFPTKVVLGTSQLNFLDSLVRPESSASMSRYVQWFSSSGGYKSTSVATRVVLEDNRSYPIRIMDMRVVKKCGPPLQGTIFLANGGAEEKIIGLGFSLDSSDTDAEIAQGEGSAEWKPNYFATYTISIEPGAQQVLDLFSYTAKAACTFRYQATILDGGKKVSQLIGDGVAPFRVTATALERGAAFLSGYQVAYIGGALTRDGAFTRVDPKTYRG